MESFVVKNFNNKEKEIVKELIQKTIQAIEIVLKENLAKAMQEYN